MGILRVASCAPRVVGLVVILLLLFACMSDAHVVVVSLMISPKKNDE